MIMPLVSVIIPTVEGDRSFYACLNSVRNQYYKNIEIIVVKEGLERSAQRNIGIKKAKGEYLLILDSDMIIDYYCIWECLKKNELGYSPVYLKERITDTGWFSRLRNWERQFYTGTCIDVVRFVRSKDCPLFDEEQHGTEDSDWDRRIMGYRVISECYYEHRDNTGIIKYFKKKAYYAKSLKRFKERNPNDKILDFKWRCFGVFIEDGKWKTFLSRPHMALGVLLIIFLRGLIYLCQKRS
jgi:glycosyltransferase involved in cell wall biosynthesis